MRDGSAERTACARFLSSVETIFLIGSVYYKNNGIINSVIRKIRLMEDMLGYRPLLLLSDYNIDGNRLILMLQYGSYDETQITLNRDSRVVSVYDYFQKTYEVCDSIIEYKKPEDADGISCREEAANICSVYNGNALLERDHYTGMFNRLRLVEYFNENRRLVKVAYYNDFGYLSMIRYLSDTDDKVFLYEDYYTTESRLVIRAFYSYNYLYENVTGEKGNIITRLQLFDGSGIVIREFDDNRGLTAYFLERFLTDKDKAYLLVAEEGLMGKAVTSINMSNVSKACVVHNIYQSNPYESSSEPQFFYKHLCENYAQFDGIIFLTEMEKEDFIKQYGDIGNSFVIPHPYPYGITPVSFEDRDHKGAVLVSRFHHSKRIDIAIDIFKLVVERVPDARLDIYGFGELEEQYAEQIKGLGLEGNVFIKGFTDNPVSVFRQASLSMVTSICEGYPLTLLESICNGCPVFSFDLKYGPSEVITDGLTGGLIPLNDTDFFAERLVQYFQDTDMQRRLSENAYNDAPRFDREVFLQRWLSFTKTLCSNKLGRA